ncbi:hypothetical protein RJ53_09680 [Methanocalculus chunghsingensis]|uniref:ADP-ribosylglycohydrolase n=1 Tax=Methanocalculus chunghsingensis TaxID=156457 RepID=A0A8J7W915_9EURY|nr:hypothetical protein [Methanocalculus chunghsingensis]
MIFIFQFTRIPGSLIGLAIGDSFGAPFEGSINIGLIPERMTGGGPFQTRRGEYTDDTLQMIALAETLITCHGFQAIDFVTRLLRIYDTHPEYFGPTSRMVLERIRSGVPPEEAAILPGVARARGGRTNGAVMRGAPIGIFYRPNEVLSVSRMAAAVTHSHPVAIACSGLVNQMISILCRGGSKETAFFRALESCDNGEVRKRVAALSLAEIIPSLDALDTTHAAITCFMEERTFREMIRRAVGYGGDTDTIAAITGALGGAFLGIGGIPQHWISEIEGAGNILALEDAVWRAGAR